jgi:hypothetical protein
MTTISEAQDEIVKTATLKECRHCAEKIKPTAKVCHYCSRVQAGFFRFSNYIRIFEGISLLVSVGLLTVAFLNLWSTQAQLTRASEASSKAEEALKRVIETERRVLQAQCDVFDLAQSVIEITEVIPRTDAGAAFQGGSLSQQDRALLKKKADSLKSKIDNFKKSEPLKCP